MAVELSQPIRMPAPDATRGTRVGTLLFGRGFLGPDPIAHAGGGPDFGMLDALRARRHEESTASASAAETSRTGH